MNGSLLKISKCSDWISQIFNDSVISKRILTGDSGEKKGDEKMREPSPRRNNERPPSMFNRQFKKKKSQRFVRGTKIHEDFSASMCFVSFGLLAWLLAWADIQSGIIYKPWIQLPEVRVLISKKKLSRERVTDAEYKIACRDDSWTFSLGNYSSIIFSAPFFIARDIFTFFDDADIITAVIDFQCHRGMARNKRVNKFVVQVNL